MAISLDWIQRQIDDLYERIRNIPRNISSLINDLKAKVRNIFTELDYLWGEIYDLYDDVREDIRDQIFDMRIWVTEKVEQPIYEYIFDKVGDIREELSDLGVFLRQEMEDIADLIPTWDDIEYLIESYYDWFEEKILKKVESIFIDIIERVLEQEVK